MIKFVFDRYILIRNVYIAGTVPTHDKHIRNKHFFFQNKHFCLMSTPFWASRKCAYYEWAQYLVSIGTNRQRSIYEIRKV